MTDKDLLSLEEKREDVCPQFREKIAQTPIETHKYKGKRYLTLNGIDQIIPLLPDIESVLSQCALDHLREKIASECRSAWFMNDYDQGRIFDKMADQIIARIYGEVSK